jgi:hypothetical protein
LNLTLDWIPGHAGPESSSQPPFTGVNEPQLPVYTCINVSKSLPQVLIVIVPFEMGVKVYQTPLPKLLSQLGGGSPVDVALSVFTV